MFKAAGWLFVVAWFALGLFLAAWGAAFALGFDTSWFDAQGEVMARIGVGVVVSIFLLLVGGAAYSIRRDDP